MVIILISGGKKELFISSKILRGARRHKKNLEQWFEVIAKLNLVLLAKRSKTTCANVLSGCFAFKLNFL